MRISSKIMDYTALEYRMPANDGLSEYGSAVLLEALELLGLYSSIDTSENVACLFLQDLP